MKELQLLGCFALFAGQRLNADEIYHRAWGEASPGAAGTVKTHGEGVFPLNQIFNIIEIPSHRPLQLPDLLFVQVIFGDGDI